MTISKTRNWLLLGTSLSMIAAPAMAQDETDANSTSRGLGEIVVTATRQSASIQKVPIAIQALTGETLKGLNVQNFSDYVSYLPNVAFAGRGPGQNDIYIRGLSTNKINVQLAGANGVAPNVALYLDDQPVTLSGRNLDIYVTDMERIEVLEGPQGTLFGSSSQAGTIRLISNKPKLGKFEANALAGVSFTKSGSMSNSFEGAINIPISDKLAFRFAGYTVHNGGYIDNVLGTATLSSNNPAFPTGATLAVTDNGSLVKKDFNDSEYNGFRAGLKYEINPDWNVTLQHSRQKLSADGVFDYDPAVGDLEVTRFFPDSLRESYAQTSWNVEGKIGALRVVYTGGYISRSFDQTLDYTGYGNIGPFIPYYICNYPAYTECGIPTLGIVEKGKGHRWNHEFRISTPSDWRFRVTAGVFYDKGRSSERYDAIYIAGADYGLPPNKPFNGIITDYPEVGAIGTDFINNYIRTDHQLSFFGEASFDIVPDLLTITGGLRRYHLVYGIVGGSSFGARGTNTAGVFGFNILDRLGSRTPRTENGTVPRVTLTLTPTDRLLFYTTYSKGFRPGGFNRACDRGTPPRTVPCIYDTDHLANYEVGWKMTLLNNRLRWNGAIYYEKWTGIQLSAFDPTITNVTFVDNAASASLKGFESTVSLALGDHFTLDGAMSYNDSKLDSVRTGLIDVAPVGSSLAQSPKFQGNIRGRYTWDIGDNEVYVEGGLRYSSKSYNSVQLSQRFLQRSYTIANATIGITRDNWNAMLYVENLTDERADLNVNNQDYQERITTNRPRTFGVKFGYKM